MEKISDDNGITHFNKLVRDKIISIIENKGEKVNYEILDDDNYANELNRKLVEEVNEYIIGNNIEEIADILEVIYAILKNRNIDINIIEEIRGKKKMARGGFENKIYLKNKRQNCT